MDTVPKFSMIGITLILAFSFCHVAEVDADLGFIISNTPEPQHHATRIRRDAGTKDGGITVERFHVISKINSRYCKVLVTSMIRNEDTVAKGTVFNVRLPEKAFVSNFSMEIYGKRYVGVVKTKEEASVAFDSAVIKGQSAALLNFKFLRHTQQFSLAVNVAVGQVVTLYFEYQEVLFRKLGRYVQSIYAKSQQQQVVQDYMIEVHISENIGLTFLEAADPGDRSSKPVIKSSNTQAYIVYRPSSQAQKSTTDTAMLTVTYDVTSEHIGGDILIKDGYFVHFYAPTNLPVIRKNVVFVIDVSGSMKGRKLEQTKQAMHTILEDLGPGDRFNILTFSDTVDTWMPNKLMDFSLYNIILAREYIQNMKGGGRTYFYEALQSGLSVLQTTANDEEEDSTSASMMIILTDGYPSVKSKEDILSGIIKKNVDNSSIFCLGFGKHLNHDFLNKLSTDNRGIHRKIYEDSDAPLQLQDFYKEVASPMLSHVRMKYEGQDVSQLTQNEFPNFFSGSEILVSGKITSNTNTNIAADSLTGHVFGSQASGSYSAVSYVQECADDQPENLLDMKRFWAYLTIQELLKNKTLIENAPTAFTNNEQTVKALNQQITDLSVKHNFVTPLTSMVAIQPQGENNTPLLNDEDAACNGRAIGINRCYDLNEAAAPAGGQGPGGRAGARGPMGMGPRPKGEAGEPGPYPKGEAGPMGMGPRPKGAAGEMIMGPRPKGESGFMAMGPRPNGCGDTTTPCTEKECQLLLSPLYGSITCTNGARVGSRCSFSCDDGYTRRGSKSLKCRVYGNGSAFWNRFPPTCKLSQPKFPSLSSTVDYNDCGESEFVIDQPINISSPYYPGLYPNNFKCIWKLKKGDGKSNIKLEILKLDLESGDMVTSACYHDRIWVFIYNNKSTRPTAMTILCGYKNNLSKLTARERFVIVMETDKVVQGHGFVMEVS